MAKLVRVEDLRVRLSVQDLPKSNNRLSAAIDSATPHIESLLQTTFDLVNGQVDDFYLDFNRDEPWHLDFARLRLSKGFLTADAVELKLASLFQELSTGDVLDPAIFGVDRNKGVVFVSDEQIGLTVTTTRRLATNRYYMRATYNAGYTVTTTEFGDVYDNVPAWLMEAAYLLAGRLYRSFSPDEETKTDSIRLTGRLTTIFPPAAIALMEKHVRFIPQAVDPIVNGYV